ncbi:MAG: iron ABC transporter permease [Afipia sp.]|nr:iron ABC transporter permease [Afipia sp.]MCR6736845.1 iron ABC transporter permease [Afipia sp.]
MSVQALPALAGKSATGPRIERGVLVVYVIVLALLVTFVVYPTFSVLRYPGLEDYVDMVSRTRWQRAALNTAFITILSTLSATLVGFAFAFAATRRDIPGARLFGTLSMLPLFAPPFMIAFAYLLMFGRQGLVSRHLFGLDLDIFGWHGLWLAQTIAFFPLASMILKGVLEGIHPSAEQAALTLGATEGAALRTITLPLVMPGVIGAMLVIAITVLADFGNAVVIAGNFPVLATEAWFLMEGLADLKGAAVVVGILLLPAIALFVISRRFLGRQSYSTVTGRGSTMDQIRTPTLLKWVIVTVCSIVSIFVVLLYLGIVYAGLADTWGSNWMPTLRHWREAMAHSDALWSSIVVALFAGALTAVLGQVAAFLKSRNLPFRRGLDFLAILPGALPGVFIGVGFVLSFNSPPLELAGSIWIVVLALGFWHLPLAYQATSAALDQIHRSIEDAARDLGASELRLVRDIYAPLLARSLLASFLQSFVRSVSNISVVVFLVAPGNVMVTFVILQMIGGTDWSGAAALTTFLLILTFLCIGLASLIAGRTSPQLRGFQP